MSLTVLDTGVIAESVNVNGEFYLQAKTVLDAVKSGSMTALVSPVTISELCYVLWRIYDGIGVRNAERVAKDFCEYIYYHPNIRIVEMSLELLLEAGVIKHRYGLALSDCLALAASKLNGCKAVFRHKEDEMVSVDLGKEFDIVFLEDYA